MEQKITFSTGIWDMLVSEKFQYSSVQDSAYCNLINVFPVFNKPRQ